MDEASSKLAGLKSEREKVRDPFKCAVSLLRCGKRE